MSNIEIRETAIKIEFTEGIQAALDYVGQSCADDIKAASPVRRGKSGGKYAKGWRYKIAPDGQTVTVYNGGKHSSLSHLLEFGHRSRSGGHVAPQEHIRPAYERNKDVFLDKLKEVKIGGNLAGK